MSKQKSFRARYYLYYVCIPQIKNPIELKLRGYCDDNRNMKINTNMQIPHNILYNFLHRKDEFVMIKYWNIPDFICHRLAVSTIHEGLLVPHGAGSTGNVLK